MKTPLIKICGIRYVESAIYAVRKGADFIGIVFHPESKRNVELDIASRISEVVSFNGGIPVAVVVDQDASGIKEICDQTGINHIQIHGDNAMKSIPYLDEKITKILSLKVDDNGYYEVPGDEVIRYLDRAKDYILYDGAFPGSGVRFPLRNFEPLHDFKFFIAIISISFFAD